MTAPAKPTPAQLTALRRIASLSAPMTVRIAGAIRTNTLWALRDRGLVCGTWFEGWTLTPAGRAVLDAAETSR